MPGALSIVLLAVVAQASTATTSNAKSTVRARFTSGAEWDTNAQRAVREGEMPLDAFSDLREVGDGLARVTADVSGRITSSRGLTAYLGYQLGAKRFTRERGQDFFTHQFFGQGAWRVAPLTFGVAGSFRLSRIRSGLRDYNIGSGNAFVRLEVLDNLFVGASGTFTGYRFLFDDHFDYRGPSAGIDVQFTPVSRLVLFANANHHWRNYERNGLTTTTIGTRPPFPSFCDEENSPAAGYNCVAELRRDTEIDLAFGARWVSTFQLGAAYRLRAQRSTSDFENTDRHRITVDTTFEIIDDLTATILAVLQFNDQTAITDTLQQAEDDENRNNLSLGLRYAISDNVAIDLRYALYLQQFSTNDASYLRQLFFLGLGYRTGFFEL